MAWESKEQAREEILDKVREYCEQFHAKKPYAEGDRISYASRVYDGDEMSNLVDSALEFWLTSGRYTDEFETEFAKYFVKEEIYSEIRLHQKTSAHGGRF